MSVIPPAKAPWPLPAQMRRLGELPEGTRITITPHECRLIAQALDASEAMVQSEHAMLDAMRQSEDQVAAMAADADAKLAAAQAELSKAERIYWIALGCLAGALPLLLVVGLFHD